MSYDIFLACVRGEDTLRFKREVFEDVFLAHCPRLKLYQADPGFMQVEYPDGGRADIYIMNTSEEEEQARKEARTPDQRLALPSFPPGDFAYFQCLSFDHFGGDAFFRDLYELTDRVEGMIYAGGGVIVTKESVLKEMPEFDTENALVVHNAAELEDAVFAD